MLNLIGLHSALTSTPPSTFGMNWNGTSVPFRPHKYFCGWMRASLQPGSKTCRSLESSLFQQSEDCYNSWLISNVQQSHMGVKFIVHILLARLCSVYGYRTAEGASRSTITRFKNSFICADSQPQLPLNPINHPAKTFCKFAYCVTMHILYGSMPWPWFLSSFVRSFRAHQQRKTK